MRNYKESSLVLDLSFVILAVRAEELMNKA